MTRVPCTSSTHTMHKINPASKWRLDKHSCPQVLIILCGLMIVIALFACECLCELVCFRHFGYIFLLLFTPEPPLTGMLASITGNLLTCALASRGHGLLQLFAVIAAHASSVRTPCHLLVVAVFRELVYDSAPSKHARHRGKNILAVHAVVHLSNADDENQCPSTDVALQMLHDEHCSIPLAEAFKATRCGRRC